MKRLVIFIACLAAFGAVGAEGARDRPKNIRIIAEYIEVPHHVLTEVMLSEHADSGPKLHARMREIVNGDKARILETSIVTSRSGQKAVIQSIFEHHSPYGPRSTRRLRQQLAAQGNPKTAFPPRLRPEFPTAFQTRNVGVTLEIEPMLGQQKHLVDLRFAPDLIDLLRYETWAEHHDQWGDGSVRRPTYETLRFSNGIALEDGKFGFVGVLSPAKKGGGRDTTRKIMLFVRADIMAIGS